MIKEKIILASSSPRRLELLKLMGITPDKVIKPNVDEKLKEDEEINSFLKRITFEKAKDVKNRINFKNTLIISADTIVEINNEIIGKPSSRLDALKILKKLSGNTHLVKTGISIIKEEQIIFKAKTSEVKFAKLKDKQIERYLEQAEYMDKAGAYAIQGPACVFVEEIKGCYFNIMGFPINTFAQMMSEFSYTFPL